MIQNEIRREKPVKGAAADESGEKLHNMRSMVSF